MIKANFSEIKKMLNILEKLSNNQTLTQEEIAVIYKDEMMPN